MIRLMLSRYTLRELHLLHNLFAQNIQYMNHICEPSRSDCKGCELRRLCSDLSLAEHFVIHTIEEQEI